MQSTAVRPPQNSCGHVPDRILYVPNLAVTSRRICNKYEKSSTVSVEENDTYVTVELKYRGGHRTVQTLQFDEESLASEAAARRTVKPGANSNAWKRQYEHCLREGARRDANILA